MIDPLPNQQGDELEARIFTSIGGSPGEPGAPGADDQDSEQFKAIEASMSKILLSGLKALRSLIAKRLPEIKDEWTDPILAGPAEAAIPLVKKYLSSIMQVLGKNEELAMFAFSMIPLAMGYLAAVDRHEKTVENVEPKPAADGPAVD